MAALVERIDHLERRNDELESRNALRDLVLDYCHGFDKKDWDRFICRARGMRGPEAE